MADNLFTGFFPAASLATSLARTSVNLLEVQRTDTGKAYISASLTTGKRSNSQPVNIASQLRHGVRTSGYLELIYNRIWVTPSAVNFGNIAGSKEETIYVWNAQFTSRELASIDKVKAQGLELVGSNLPIVFGALLERSWILQANNQGDAQLDAQIIFKFTDENALVLTVTGNRVTAWTFAIDWSQEVVESLEWLTDVLVSTSLAEQRRALRITPRRSYEFTALAFAQERQQLNLALHSWGARKWALPIYPDAQLLTQQLAVGADFISCTTAGYDFSAGGYALVQTDALHYELVSIARVTETGLQLNYAVVKAHPAASKLIPTRAAFFSSEPQLKKITDDLQSISVNFLLDSYDAPAEYTFEHSYRNYPLLTLKPEDSEQLTSTYYRLIKALDNDTATPQLIDIADTPLPVQAVNYQCFGRDEQQQLKQLLSTLCGKQSAVWLPTFMQDLTVTRTVADLATIAYIQYCELARFFNAELNGKRDICITTTKGVFYRRILSVAPENDHEEKIHLDKELGVELYPSDFVRISFMFLARSDSDSARIKYLTDADGTCSTSLIFKGVTDEL